MAAAGTLVGISNLIFHLTTDPLADVRAYYDAASRLNAGQPLYLQPATTTEPAFYRYPPLLAIAFRPLAMLPYPIAAGLWEGLIIAAVLYTFWRLGLRPETWLAAGILALPIAWAVTIGQAQVLVTALVLGGPPAGVALAADLKVFPALIAIYWIGRRDWTALGRFAAWFLGLAVAQIVLEPRGSIAYLSFLTLEQVGDVNNLSLFVISPVLWAIGLVVGTIAAARLAPTRWGWAAAVVLSVLAPPRLLTYQLSTLLAVLRPSAETRD
jgi:hypothetical protein